MKSLSHASPSNSRRRTRQILIATGLALVVATPLVWMTLRAGRPNDRTDPVLADCMARLRMYGQSLTRKLVVESLQSGRTEQALLAAIDQTRVDSADFSTMPPGGAPFLVNTDIAAWSIPAPDRKDYVIAVRLTNVEGVFALAWTCAGTPTQIQSAADFDKLVPWHRDARPSVPHD